MFTLSAVALIAVAFFVLEPLARYIWDPKRLRRFPNQNFLSGITNLGYIFERCRGYRSKNLHEVHKKHPIVRIGPNSVSFSTPDAIRAIYGHSTPCLKGDVYSTPAGAHSSLLDVVDKSHHARKRRYMSNVFATRNLQNWEFKVADKVIRLLRQFDKVCDDATAGGTVAGSIDCRKWTNLFTVEAIVDIALSHNLGVLERGDDLVTMTTPEGEEIKINYITCLHAPRRANSILVWATAWFLPLKKLLMSFPGFFRSSWRQGENFDRLVKLLVQERVQRAQDGEHLDDLVQSILEDKKAGKSRDLEIGEIEAEVTVLMDAGSDTTAIALSNAMYYLLRNPEHLARLREELNDALEPEAEIASYDRVKNLPYLRACLDESMRLSPPVAFGLHRKTPDSGMTIDGEWIAGNTTVAVPAYTAHRNDVVFARPEEYRPERWLDDQGKDAQASFIPFSTGARGCIGRNISYIEQTMLIATLVRRYDFALPSSTWEPRREEAFNLWSGPMPMDIKRRSGFAKAA